MKKDVAELQPTPIANFYVLNIAQTKAMTVVETKINIGGMMSNIIKFNKNEYPNDLLTFAEVKEKYGLGYSFVYKWAMIKKELTAYDKAGIAVSEKELLEFLQNRTKKWRMPRKHGE